MTQSKTNGNENENRLKMNAPDKIYMPNELLSEEWTRHIEGQDTAYIRLESLWHKESEPPTNKHPYPVLNPDTGEMAFAYYYLGWHFDRDYAHSSKMLWLDIEAIIPPTKED